VAIAVNNVLADESLQIRRVLVVDWDCHYGNGTQSVFADDSRVLFFSIHRFDEAEFYPYSPAAGPANVGHGSGSGTTVNVGWNTTASTEDTDKLVDPPGDAAYLSAWRRVLLPIAKDFDPDLVIVSAGFDSARGDEMGGLDVTPAGYARLLHELVTLRPASRSPVPCVVALEGGYSIEPLTQSALACMSVLLGDVPPANTDEENLHQLTPSVVRDIDATVIAIAPYYKALESDAEEARSRYHAPRTTRQGAQRAEGGCRAFGSSASIDSGPDPEPPSLRSMLGPKIDLKKFKGEDVHNSVCTKCELGGKLLCCDWCTLVYHKDCLPQEPKKDDDFACPECLRLAERKRARKLKELAERSIYTLSSN
jgi:hypothetical protein